MSGSKVEKEPLETTRGTDAGQHTALESLKPLHFILFLTGLFALNLLLRAFYFRYDFLNGDEGVRALTATRLLEGARLYVDVVTDKPPGATFFYAAVFAVFGRSMKALHVIAALWSSLSAVLLFFVTRRALSVRTALCAALVLVYFSTNYFNQDMMAANTELLLSVPYVAAFLFYWRALEHSRGDEPPGSGSMLFGTAFNSIASGVMTASAILFKQTGAFILIFFVLYETIILFRARRSGVSIVRVAAAGIRRLGYLAAGLVATLGFFAGWLITSGAGEGFWHNAIMLNMFYVESESFPSWLMFLTRRGLSYVLFNAALWIPASISAASALKPPRRLAGGVMDESREPIRGARDKEFLVAVTLWTAVSLAVVLLGGRFFGHYFIPSLPGLSILAADRLLKWTDEIKNRRIETKRAFAFGLVILLFVFGVVRFHHRTAILAYETLTGRLTYRSQQWGMSKRQQEAEVVSRFVSSRLGPGEPLYIWGYAHDVYWRTGCRPASRYLTPYYIDGRFPDAEITSAPPRDVFWDEARTHLIEDLYRNRPRMILEVYGGMRELPYPEIVEFIRSNYAETGHAGPDPSRPFRVLELKDDVKQNRPAD